MSEEPDLIAWLRAQLDDDERAAQAAGGGAWTHRVDPDYPSPDMRVDDHTLWFESRFACEVGFGDGEIRPAEAEHIARHDPARMLAEVDAKRALLDLHGLMYRDVGWLETGDDGSRDEAYEELEVCGLCVPKHSHFSTRVDVPTGPCQTLRLLALPYADRPGYRDEWGPA